MKRTRVASAAILAVILTFFVGTSTVQLFGQAGTWATKTSMPTPRYGLGTDVVNGIIYAVGGYNGTQVGTVEAYNPASDTWTTKAPMPTARFDFGISVVNGILYAIGGQTPGPVVGTVEAYDPATDTWTTKASMPTARSGLSASVVNGIIYAVGGASATAFVGTVEAYDPASDTWTTKASMPTGRFTLGTSVVNGIVYAVGGYNGSELGTVEAYDPASDTWTTKASMPTARHGLGTSPVNGVIYAVAGVISGVSGNSPLATVEAYDPAADTWSTKSPMPTARFSLATSAVNNVIYAVGGAPQLGVTLGTVEAFTPPLPPLVGDGSAITNLTAANISAGTAGISITGNAATATSASGLTCTACVGNTQLGVNYAGSASQAGPATSALLAGLANEATDSLSLGSILAANFARLDIGNAFTGSQSVSGNLAVSGATAIGSGGTPILKHLSLTVNPAFPALKPQTCNSLNFAFTGASDGDTIALGVPNSRMTGGGALNYFAWIPAANTITIRACNIDLVKQTIAGSGAIRVDVWKH